MRRAWLCRTIVTTVFVSSVGIVGSAATALHAVVEDSTTLVILDSDSTEVFRKRIEFAMEISSRTQIKELEFGAIAVIFNYAPGDTVLVNPLPGIREFERSRGHLIIIDCEGRELLSADTNPYGLYPDVVVMTAPDTLVVLHADVGEVVRIDLNSKEVQTRVISDWGCPCYSDIPCPGGSAEMLPGGSILLTRSDYDFCGTGVRSEVLALGADGQVLWRHEARGFLVEMRLVDRTNRLVILVQRYAPTGESEYYQLRVLSEAGEVAWEANLGSRVVRRMELRGDTLCVWVRSIGSGAPEERLPWDLIRFDPRTGEARGD